MRKRRLSLSLFAIFLAACAPAETQIKPAETTVTPIILESTATPVVDLTVTGVITGGLNSATPPPSVSLQAAYSSSSFSALPERPAA
jgi:hypothetical protein